jgi:hypothetical protein
MDMKRIVFTFSIFAVIVFAGVYSFYNLKEKPAPETADIPSVGKTSHPYEMPPDSTYKTFSKRSATTNDAHSHSSFRMKQDNDDAEIRLWIKVSFSGVFCLAALYVILSKRYEGRNNEVRKWAYSVLTLIAGVWIGTAT